MRHIEIELRRARGPMESPFLFGAIAVLFCITGCGGGTKDTPTPSKTQQQGPQTYFAPYVFSTTNGGVNSLFPGVNIYEIDDFADSFSQSVFKIVSGARGPQTINAGTTKAVQRGLLTLGTTANYDISQSTPVVTTFRPPKTGGFAVELANQAGALIQIAGQPVAPLVAATQCPNSKTALTYQFITIPAGRIDSSMNGSQPPFWDPTKNTAYGSVDITSDGTNVTFDNIHQYTFPSAGITGPPAQPSKSPKTGLCGATALGNTISVPGQLITTSPGIDSNTSPQATIGIGPTGLLLEDNGIGNNSTYEDVLGDGTGAVGLPKPSNPLDTNNLRGAQYLGFVYGAGVFSGNVTAPSNGWSSHPVSFGSSTTPSSCANVVANTGATIYGGDFTNDDPSTSPDGFGNSNLAIDLGKQDASNDGLFPSATICLGASYAANTTGKTYSFPAVAIAGQLNGKYAIFVLGVDPTQPWAIYLLPSN